MTPPTPHHSHSGTGNTSPSPESLRATVSTAIQATRLTLKDAGIDEAPLEAEVLVRHVVGIDRTALYAGPDRRMTEVQLQALQALVARRCQREPLPYILGHWEFYGLDFLVNPAVLIPRPETETLVEEALRRMRRNRPSTGSRRTDSIADVGTGSGCIAIALAVHLPQATVAATDISADALAVAGQNAERHHVQNRIRLVQGDLLSGWEDELDLIVSNPPYIPDAEVSGLQPLRGGPDGLSVIRRLLEQASNLLSPNGAIMLEFNPPQRDMLLSEANRLWPEAGCRIVQDLAGLDRVLVVELEGRASA